MKLTRAEIGALIVTLAFIALASGYILADHSGDADFVIKTENRSSDADILTGGDVLAVSMAGNAGGAGDKLPVNLNAASADELTALPGIGGVLAERIVAHREKNGDFEQIEDIMDVYGIGETIFNSISSMITVG